MLARPENTVTSTAKLLGVSRNTIYNDAPELKGGRRALTEATHNTGTAPTCKVRGLITAVCGW
ncbi:helix-turn-helix domain-containing protein [Streptomyces sp. NBC_00841]|uniref:hypothetical protein n=1 Tax=unclassified Streptomyces TaxID=2593676 RepID=UPI00225AC916|nr:MULTISPECIES: hypothetical protein [unclassified Streptomyces]MCX4537080.1 helix-turn-helix domain-containing protein [Streptomyces sp. NBC_01669]WRZ97676.1 helix-turn-helix domain-containing protein [Streptomyces sp. NBC_00841]